MYWPKKVGKILFNLLTRIDFYKKQELILLIFFLFFCYCNNICNLLLFLSILQVFCTFLPIHRTFLILITQRNISLIHYLNCFLFLTYFELSSFLLTSLDINYADIANLDRYEILNSHNSHFLWMLNLTFDLFALS